MYLALSGLEDNLEWGLNFGVPAIHVTHSYLQRYKDRGASLLKRAKERGVWVLASFGATTDFEKYFAWLETNLCFLDAFQEFDSSVGIWKRRDRLDALGASERMIVTPYQELDKVLARYAYVGTHDGSIFLEPTLKKQTLVHGWLDSYKVMLNHPFYSVASSAWLAGQRYGLTYHFAGNHLKTYSKDRKNIRKVLAAECKDLGIDTDAFLRDEWQAVAQFNLYQWIQFAQMMKARNEEAKDNALVRHDYTQKQALEAMAVVNTARMCDTCLLSGKCPGFQAGATCSLASRPEIRNAEDIKALILQILEMQSERVLFGLFSERVSGVALDERVSKELLQLITMMQAAKDLSSDGAELQIQAKGTGVITKLLEAFSKHREEKKPASKVIDVDSEE